MCAQKVITDTVLRFPPLFTFNSSSCVLTVFDKRNEWNLGGMCSMLARPEEKNIYKLPSSFCKIIWNAFSTFSITFSNCCYFQVCNLWNWIDIRFMILFWYRDQNASFLIEKHVFTYSFSSKNISSILEIKRMAVAQKWITHDFSSSLSLT